MKKILIPTDFSTNSKSAIRFGLLWSKSEKIVLEFIYVTYHIRKTQWSDDYYQKLKTHEILVMEEKLKEFIESLIHETRTKPAKYICTVIEGFSPDLSIMEYCRRHKEINFICISTRGAGRVKRIFGTNTGNLITKSDVPVIAIPKNYRNRPFKNVFYAADFHNYKNELERVIKFARPLKMPIEVLHFVWPYEAMPDIEILDAGTRAKFKFPVNLHVELADPKCSFVEDFQHHIQEVKPSIAVMFTDRSRNLWQRIFLPSKAEELSFALTTPLLVFNKA